MTIQDRGAGTVRLQFFIIRNPALGERRRYLEHVFEAADQPVHFVEIEHSNPDLPRVLYCGDELEWYRKSRTLYTPEPRYRRLSRPETHNAASHLLAINSVTEDWGIILEDDAILAADFFATVREKLAVPPSGIGCVVLGGGYPHEKVSASISQFDLFQIKTHPATNTAVAYALRPGLAQRLARSCRGIDLPFDLELGYLLMINNALVAHLIPYLVQEGSKTGAYPSAIQAHRPAGRR